jgi:hypothetical protein
MQPADRLAVNQLAMRTANHSPASMPAIVTATPKLELPDT